MKLQSFLALGSLAAVAVSAPLTQTKREDDCTCTPEKVQQRVEYNTMPEWERKAFTDSILCLMDQPSQLDQTQYPAAINRYFDYAVVHVSRTQNVHLSGFFLTWHRMFLHLFEQDLRTTCGYAGRWPYWNFAATAGSLESSPILDGSDFSLSGNGEYNDTGPIQLGPSLSIPHGSGGGCVTSGPFANLEVPLAFIDPNALQTGTLPADAFAYQPSCLRRDLNDYVATTYANWAEVVAATHSSDAAALELALNGVIGSASLGVHSGAHFEVGGQMNSIHISASDPIWFPLHTFIDVIYDSWQRNNPSVFDDLYGTETALNVPPTPNVTLDTIEPDWGYFYTQPTAVRDLLNITSGPFCYEYDLQIS